MRKLRSNEKAIVRTMGMMVAFLVAIIIGVLVFYEVNDNLQVGGDNQYTAGFEQTWNNTNDTAGTVWNLLPITAIVIIAGIILSVVISFGTKPGGGL